MSVEMSTKVRRMSSKKTSLLSILYLFNTCSAINEDIDKEHHDMFPYCGSMFRGADQTKARAINAKNSTDEYRWAAFLVRENTQPKSGDTISTGCSGTIISDR